MACRPCCDADLLTHHDQRGSEEEGLRPAVHHHGWELCRQGADLHSIPKHQMHRFYNESCHSQSPNNSPLPFPQVPLKYMAAFSASKYALSGFTEAVRAEVEPFGVHIGQVRLADVTLVLCRMFTHIQIRI